jgi:hypothetical protein
MGKAEKTISPGYARICYNTGYSSPGARCSYCQGAKRLGARAQRIVVHASLVLPAPNPPARRTSVTRRGEADVIPLLCKTRLRSGKAGVYGAVLIAGTIRPGDEIALVD